MSDKTIEIRGRKVSEATIVEALKKHCDFQEEETVPIISFGTYNEKNDRVII